MTAILSRCGTCGFENPRAWRACARCGRSLVAPVGEEDAPAPDATQVEPAPSATAEGDPEEESTTGEDTSPGLQQGAPDDVGEQEAETPLIGQGEASEAIRTGVERAFSLGAPTLVALEGTRGSGKSRLLVYASELAARLSPDVRLYYGSCRAGGTDGDYAPFGRLLLERFGVTPSSSPSAVRAQMNLTVSELIQSTDAIEIAETTHLLGHLAGIPFPDSPFLARLKDRPDELHRRACVAMRKLLEGEAQSRPVQVLLDNLHNAQDGAWDILAEIARAEAHLSIVVAGDAPVAERAEELAPSGGFAAGPIEALEQEDIAAMLHVLLPTLQEASEPLVAAVTHRSGGNPSAVRELVRALEEAGVFVQGPEGELTVDLARLEQGDLPITTSDAVRARLERLDPFERATLDRAAVVGERFWDGAILGQMRAERQPPGDASDPLSIWPDAEDADALGQALTRLQSKGFVTALVDSSDLPGTHEYAFALAGTRDMLYESIDEDLRVRRHAAVARWLTVVAEMNRPALAALIAPHLEKAGQSVRAGRAYAEAAANERAHLRTTTALRYIEHALPLIPEEDVARRIDALHEHGSLLTTLGRYDEAIRAFTEMLRRAWSIGARGKGGAALNRIGRVHRQRGEDETARRYLARALELFRPVGDLRGVAATLDDLAQIDRLQGHFESAMQAANEALEIRRAHGDARGEALSLHTIAAVELMRGHLDQAEQMFRQGAELRQSIGDHEAILQSENALGIVAFERGDRDAAVSAWKAALEQARQMADRRSECFLLNNIGEALIEEGRLDEASSSLGRAKELATALGDRRAAAEVERNLGILALRRGADEAQSILEHAKELATEYGSTEAIALAHRALGMFHAQTLFDAEGEPDRTAEESFLTSIDLFRDMGNEKEAARSLADLGHHLIERGDLETARERLREARSIMRRIGLADLDRVDRTLAELG